MGSNKQESGANHKVLSYSEILLGGCRTAKSCDHHEFLMTEIMTKEKEGESMFCNNAVVTFL